MKILVSPTSTLTRRFFVGLSTTRWAYQDTLLGAEEAPIDYELWCINNFI